MRKEDNREKYKEYDHQYYIKHRRPNSKIGKLETKISDLEAKLAGKDQAIESLEELNRSLGQTCNNDRKEIERLRELISDKEKENDTLTAKLEQANEIINNPDTLIFQQQELIDNLQSQLAEKDKAISNLNGLVRERDKQIKNLKTNKKRVIEHKNKNKISFTIEQLEKVKDYFIEGYAVCKNFSDFYWNFTEQIDNQIKKLTHQHEDKGE